MLDSSARASLRSAVWALRRALGAGGRLLVDAGRDLARPPDAAVGRRARDRAAAGRGLEEALELGEGELLAGFDDDWALQARDDFRDRVSGVLERSPPRPSGTATPRRRSAGRAAQVALDPLDEAAHRD